MKKLILNKLGKDNMLKTRDTESKVSYNLHVHSGVTSAMAKRPELSTMETIIAKTYGEPVQVSQEFFGLFKKKIKVLSKIDYEATASNLGRNYDYSGDDLKDIIDFNNVFEDEAFEIIGRNNEGFSPEYGGDEDLQDALSSLKECMPIEANIIAKKIKLSNDYSPIKTLDKEHIDREYSLELFEKSIKYYEEDCIGLCRDSLKEAESDGANPKFIANLKEYIRLSQRAIEEAKDTINILKKNFKFEEAKD